MPEGLPLVSNGGSQPLAVWIEPWCDELTLPPRATLGCCMLDAPVDAPRPELEVNAEGTLVVWASTPGRMVFTVNDVVQDTGSRMIVLPANLLAMPVKRFVHIAFGKSPEARPAGVLLSWHEPPSWWCRVQALFRR